jgi:hypothetical protein
MELAGTFLAAVLMIAMMNLSALMSRLDDVVQKRKKTVNF